MAASSGGDSSAEQYALTRMYVKICTTFPIETALPALISHRVIDFNEKAKIFQNNLSRHDQVSALMDIISKDVQVEDYRRFNNFLIVLRKSRNCQFLWQGLQQHLQQHRQRVRTSLDHQVTTDQSTTGTDISEEYTDFDNIMDNMSVGKQLPITVASPSNTDDHKRPSLHLKTYKRSDSKTALVEMVSDVPSTPVSENTPVVKKYYIMNNPHFHVTDYEGCQLISMTNSGQQFPIDVPKGVNFNSLHPFTEDIINSIKVDTIVPPMLAHGLLTPEHGEYFFNPHVLSIEKQRKLGFLIVALSEEYIQTFLQCLKNTRDYEPHNDLLKKIQDGKQGSTKPSKSPSAPRLVTAPSQYSIISRDGGNVLPTEKITIKSAKTIVSSTTSQRIETPHSSSQLTSTHSTEVETDMEFTTTAAPFKWSRVKKLVAGAFGEIQPSPQRKHYDNSLAPSKLSRGDPTLPYYSPQQSPKMQTFGSSVPRSRGKHQDDRPTLKQLNRHVLPQACVVWKNLGLEFLSADKILVIQANNPGDVQSCCNEMFKLWLQRDTKASWDKLINALRIVGLFVLADEIERRFAVAPAMLRESSRDQPTSPTIVDDNRIKFASTKVTKLDQMASHSPSISAILQTKPELADLVNWVVPMAADKWEMICVLLMGDEGQTIGNAIRREFQLIEECCLEMFSEWLQYRDATWQNIIDVLISVRKLALAEELTERLVTLQGPMPPSLSPVNVKQPHQQQSSQQMARGSYYSQESTGITPSLESTLMPNVTLVLGAVVIDQIQNKDDTPTKRGIRKYVPLEYAADWFDIGIELGLELDVLDDLKGTGPQQSSGLKQNNACLRKMLYEWLKSPVTPTATWKALEVAFTNVRRQKLGLDPVDDVYMEDTGIVQSCNQSDRKVLSTLNRLLHDLRADYKAKQKSPAEEWPPNQPTSVVSVALIHYRNRRTQREFIEISKQFRETDYLSSHSRVTKDINLIFAANPTDQTVITSSTSRPPKRILIEGTPGIGKTVLAKEIAYSWATGTLLQGCEFVFLVPLRDPRVHEVTSFTDLLQLFMFERVTSDLEMYFMDARGEKIVFVFDGFDEYPASLQHNSFITDIITGKLLRHFTLVVTSRPTATLFLHHLVDRRIEILGFAKEQRDEYISHSLNGLPAEIQIHEYLKHHPIINGFCFIPLYLSMLVFLFKIGKLPETLTEMNEFFIIHTLYRYLLSTAASDKHMVKKLTELPEVIYRFVLKLAELAFKALGRNQLVFSYNEIRKVCREVEYIPGATNGFGLLQAVQHYTQKGAGRTMSFNFLHFTMQEYLAALHMSTLPDEEQLHLMNNMTFWDSQYNHMWMMYVGITGLHSNTLISFLSVPQHVHSVHHLGEISLSNDIQTDKLKRLLLYQCYREAKSDIVPKPIISMFSGGSIDFSGLTLLPHHMIFFISASAQQRWRILELGNCNLKEIGMNILLEHIIQNKENISTLEYVDLSGNHASPWGVYCAIIRHCCVNSLTLCGDDGMEEHVKELTYSLEGNRTLESLTLCRVGRIGVKSIKEVLVNNTTLDEVNFSWKKISSGWTKDTKYVLVNTKYCFNTMKYSITNGNCVAVNILGDEYYRPISNMSNKNVNDDVLSLIAFGLYNNTTLFKLSVSNNSITSDGVFAISECLKCNTTLKDLDISGNSITSKGAELLSNVLQVNSTLKKLKISRSKIQDDGIVAISSCLQSNENLQELILSYNSIAIDGAKGIARLIRLNTTLQKLVISHCNIPDDGAVVISESYKKNRTLQELVISWNMDQVTVNTAHPLCDLSSKNIGNTGSLILSYVLYKNVKMQKLNVSHNSISDDGVIPLAQCLKYNYTLIELDVSHNDLTSKGKSLISVAAQSNRKLTVFI